jgi:hypothetical protein
MEDSNLRPEGENLGSLPLDQWVEREPSTGVEPAATSLRKRHPTAGVSMATGAPRPRSWLGVLRAAARAGIEPAIDRLTAGCLATWLPCNANADRDRHDGRGRRTPAGEEAPRRRSARWVPGPVEISKNSDEMSPWIREQESNLHSRVQSPPSCLWTIPEWSLLFVVGSQGIEPCPAG